MSRWDGEQPPADASPDATRPRWPVPREGEHDGQVPAARALPGRPIRREHPRPAASPRPVSVLEDPPIQVGDRLLGRVVAREAADLAAWMLTGAAQVQAAQ